MEKESIIVVIIHEKEYKFMQGDKEIAELTWYSGGWWVRANSPYVQEKVFNTYEENMRASHDEAIKEVKDMLQFFSENYLVL